DSRKDYLEKKERGELLSQQIDLLKWNILQPVNLLVTKDGEVHFGDVVMLMNKGGEHRSRSILSINANLESLIKNPSPAIKSPCGVSAGRVIQPSTRNAFIVTSVDGSAEGSTLRFEQKFALRATSGFARGVIFNVMLWFTIKFAEKSGLQAVYLNDSHSPLSWWRIVHFDPEERLEYKDQPVPADEKVLLFHCWTNKALAVMEDQVIWTIYGNEYEVTAHTFLDSHKVERDNNHWILCTKVPPEDERAPSDALAINIHNQELTQPHSGTPNQYLQQ
ncbi:cilia and flagella associated protein 161, partial [Nothobranchius furzeri]